MDPKDNMPDIKTEVNKLDDGKKKSAGLLATLFGRGGSGAGGLGGLGGGSTAGGGGMLATKAGMMALVIMGTAVAGGIGMAGYKVFGPGDSDRSGGSLALFAPKPASTQADPNAVAPVRADGSSTSLDYMAQAAAKDRAAEAAAIAANEQAVAAGASAAVSDASNAGSAGALNAGSGGAGAIGMMNKGLVPAKKMGDMSKGGAGNSSSVSAGGSKLGDGLAAAGQNGSLSAFSKNGPGARASLSSGRGIASRRSASAQQGLGMVRRDHVGATSSIGAGKTYDGSAAAGGSAIGPGGTAIGMDGAGAGGDAQPKAIDKNSAPNAKKIDPPMPVAKHVKTTWQELSKRAMMLGLLVAALALAANLLKKATFMSPGTVQMLLKAIGMAIIGIGAYIGMLAGQIITGVGGEPGQKLQGAFVAFGAIAAIATGIVVMSMSPDVPASSTPPPAPVPGDPNFIGPLKPVMPGDANFIGPVQPATPPTQVSGTNLPIDIG